MTDKKRVSILRDATIVKRRGKEYLFGTVVQDDRFPIGHRILTSIIVSIDMEEKKVITYTGTVYKFENMLTKEELASKLKENEKDEKKLEYLLDCIL